MTLWIVEDEAKTSSFLKRGFSEAGFLVHVASDGFEGKHQIKTESFELIVLDILLPGMDGWELLTWSRSSGIQTPILLLTARDSVADRVRGLELGAVCAAWSYVPRDPTGLNLHRTDSSNIQFLVNEKIAAGLTTPDGRVWITGDSDPLKADRK